MELKKKVEEGSGGGCRCLSGHSVEARPSPRLHLKHLSTSDLAEAQISVVYFMFVSNQTLSVGL